MRLKLTLEYDGRGFSGWQVQAGLVTVQGELERAFGILCRRRAEGEAHELDGGTEDGDLPADGSVAAGPDEAPLPYILVTGSGRTDAGVHARGQVASVEWPDSIPCDPTKLARSLSGLTPPELTVLSVERAAPDFDARSTPHLKQYSYHLTMRRASPALEIGRTARLDDRADVRAMIEAARIFKGQHDFGGFRASDCTAKSSVRTLELSELVRINESELLYIVRGKGFLKQMVRMIVGALSGVGTGRIELGELRDALAQGVRPRSPIRTAPAAGLTLDWVRYSGIGIR